MNRASVMCRKISSGLTYMSQCQIREDKRGAEMGGDGQGQEDETENGTEKIFEEIVAKMFPKLYSINSTNSCGINTNKTTPRHILVKQVKKKKDKEENLLKVKSKRHIRHKSITIRMSADIFLNLSGQKTVRNDL